MLAHKTPVLSRDLARDLGRCGAPLPNPQLPRTMQRGCEPDLRMKAKVLVLASQRGDHLVTKFRPIRCRWQPPAVHADISQNGLTREKRRPVAKPAGT
jgi:hypothetical protein